MAGTKEGGVKTAKTNKKLYGKDYYSQIAKRGWSAEVRATRRPGGFAAMPREKVQAAGKKGGTNSRRYK